jgi:ComF family protein
VALLRSVLDLLFPPACQVCRTPGPDVLCRTCTDRFRLIRAPVCDRCGKPLRGPPDLLFTCTSCRHRRLYFRHARAVGIYDGPLRDAVHALKFKGRSALSEPLGAMMARVAISDWVLAGSEMVVPVPLHPARQAERGFNQSELLAREVALALRRPLTPRAVQRARPTEAQSGLPLPERRANVRGAFIAAPLTARRVLLIDDVLSTGFTAGACAHALRTSGAQQVVVLTLARSVLD